MLQIKKLRFCKKQTNKKQEKKVTIDDVNEKVKIFLRKEKKGGYVRGDKNRKNAIFQALSLLRQRDLLV